jgi:hypothetical protein
MHQAEIGGKACLHYGAPDLSVQYSIGVIQKRGWVLSNPLNPSTKRLLSIKVKKITGRQIYIVKKETEGWKIFQNLRPSPRSSIPHRWKKKQKT